MKPRLIFGAALLLMVAFCVSLQILPVHGGGTSEDAEDYQYDEEYDDEYEDYVDEDQSLDGAAAAAADSDKLSSTSSTTTTPTTTTTSTTPPSTAAPVESEEDDAPILYPCPEQCSCDDATASVNCSSRALAEIPPNLPKTLLRLDLSGNGIRHVPVEAFQACADVSELLLDRNALEDIDKEVFIGLGRLTMLSLAGNQLQHLAQDNFAEAKALRRLILSENPLVVPDEGPFLEQPALEHLEMAWCNLTELNNHAFIGLENLKSLNLAGNEFDEDLSSDVFEPLSNLEQLHLPPLSEDAVRDLCDIVKTIDVVDITTHNISCYYLASETSYEESIITPRPATPEPRKDEQHRDLKLPDAGASKPTKKAPQKENEIEPAVNDDGSKAGTAPTAIPSHKQQAANSGTPNPSGPSSASITHTVEDAVSAGDASQNGTKKSPTTTAVVAADGEKSLLASISSETMKQALMGIIALGILLLIIGIICRRSGLKNKFCGSKRRPAPTDQVRPAEEVPLNKV